MATSTATRVEYVDLDTLVGATRNPKNHELAAIRASIARFGFVTPAVLDGRTGRLVVGHGRTKALRAMKDDGETPPQGVTLGAAGEWLVPVNYGWASRSDAEAEAYLVVDNQHTIAGGWDDPELSQLVMSLNEVDPTLVELLGFDDDVLATLIEGVEPEGDWDGEGGGGEDGADKGALLGLAGTTVGEPEFDVASGEVWWMGEDHVLVVANPHTEWQLWTGLLVGEAIFLPYPSPLAGLIENPEGRRVVLVQPNKYLAGWVLTKWARVTGGTPRRVEA